MKRSGAALGNSDPSASETLSGSVLRDGLVNHPILKESSRIGPPRRRAKSIDLGALLPHERSHRVRFARARSQKARRSAPEVGEAELAAKHALKLGPPPKPAVKPGARRASPPPKPAVKPGARRTGCLGGAFAPPAKPGRVPGPRAAPGPPARGAPREAAAEDSGAELDSKQVVDLVLQLIDTLEPADVQRVARAAAGPALDAGAAPDAGGEEALQGSDPSEEQSTTTGPDTGDSPGGSSSLDASQDTGDSLDVSPAELDDGQQSPKAAPVEEAPWQAVAQQETEPPRRPGRAPAGTSPEAEGGADAAGGTTTCGQAEPGLCAECGPVRGPPQPGEGSPSSAAPRAPREARTGGRRTSQGSGGNVEDAIARHPKKPPARPRGSRSKARGAAPEEASPCQARGQDHISQRQQQQQQQQQQPQFGVLSGFLGGRGPSSPGLLHGLLASMQWGGIGSSHGDPAPAPQGSSRGREASSKRRQSGRQDQAAQRARKGGPSGQRRGSLLQHGLLREEDDELCARRDSEPMGGPRTQRTRKGRPTRSSLLQHGLQDEDGGPFARLHSEPAIKSVGRISPQSTPDSTATDGAHGYGSASLAPEPGTGGLAVPRLHAGSASQGSVPDCAGEDLKGPSSSKLAMAVIVPGKRLEPGDVLRLQAALVDPEGLKLGDVQSAKIVTVDHVERTYKVRDEDGMIRIMRNESDGLLVELPPRARPTTRAG